MIVQHQLWKYWRTNNFLWRNSWNGKCFCIFFFHP